MFPRATIAMHRAAADIPTAPRARRATPLALACLCLLAVALLLAPAPASGAILEPEGSFPVGAGPAGVASDDAGRVYVAAADAGRVEVYDNVSDGNRFLRTIGEGILVRPVGIAIDNRGRIYVTDAGRNVVVFFEALTDGAAMRRQFGGDGTELGKVAGPRAVTTDASTRPFVVERGNARVQWFRSSGGKSVPVAAFGVAEPASFDQPEGIDRDIKGRVYLSNDSRTDGAVRVYDERGFLLRQIAEPGADAGQVAGPRGLLLDPFGRLLVTDAGNSRLHLFDIFDAGAAHLETLDAAHAGFVAPADAVIAPGAQLYVTDAGTNRVVRIRYDDADRDGALDRRDNCLGLADVDQFDTNRDGEGDACDPDDDGDGVADIDDRCPKTIRGLDANRDGCGDPRTTIATPAERQTYRRRRPPSRLTGTAQADEAGVEAVEVALAREAGGRCRWYRGGRFGPPQPCTEPTYFRAQGGERWVARVRGRALTPASYRLLARTTQFGGVVETALERRNSRRFRVVR